MKKLFTLFVMVFVISGCVTTSTRKLANISLDMSKEEVINGLGEPTVMRGALKNKYNQTIEVWEYKLSKAEAGRFWGNLAVTTMTFGIWAPVAYEDQKKDIANYWLYFYDDKLVQWGQAGDWKKEADRIYDFNFSIGDKITQ